METIVLQLIDTGPLKRIEEPAHVPETLRQVIREVNQLICGGFAMVNADGDSFIVQDTSYATIKGLEWVISSRSGQLCAITTRT